MKYPIMSEERLKETQVFFRDFPNLTAEEIVLYANFAEIVDILTGHKLDTNTILESSDLLSDLILNLRPDIMIVPKEDRIRAQLGRMDTIPSIANTLNMEEKTLFAFCVYWSVCIRVYDEDTDEECNGLVDFTSVEKILAEYEQTRNLKPELFENVDIVYDEQAAGYGYSLKNPIKATSVGKAYEFLNRLAVSGATVAYKRIGARSGKRDHIVDVYEVAVTTNTPAGRKKQIYELYIDPYCITNSKKAPKPFFLL